LVRGFISLHPLECIVKLELQNPFYKLVWFLGFNSTVLFPKNTIFSAMKKNSLFVMTILSLSFLLNGFGTLHEYYISITNIDYNPMSQTIEISQQYIAHDVEKAILRKHNVNLHLAEPNEHPQADSILEVYFRDNFELSIDSTIQLNWIGREVKLDESLFIYLQSEKIEQPDKLTVKNTSLTEVFPAQSNITHVKIGDQQHTKSINRITNTHTFTAQ